MGLRAERRPRAYSREDDGPRYKGHGSIITGHYNQALVFENSPSGVASSVAAGILTVGITSTQDPETLESLGSSSSCAASPTRSSWPLSRIAEAHLYRCLAGPLR